ncbi:MAG: metallophosphoesterase [Promethearchaeota archaeon]
MTLSEQNQNQDIARLLQVILQSKVNIDPYALWFLSRLKVSDSDLEEFLQHIAFLPHFSSYISYDFLKEEWLLFQKKRSKIHKTDNKDKESSNIEEAKTLKNSSMQISTPKKQEVETNSGDKEIIDPEFDFESAEVDEILGESFSKILPSSLKASNTQRKQTILAPNPKIPVEKNPLLRKQDQTDHELKGLDAPESIDINPELQILDLKTSSPNSDQVEHLKNMVNSTHIAQISPNQIQSKKNNLEPSAEKSSNHLKEEESSKVERIHSQKRKSWESLEISDSSKLSSLKSGTSMFKPIAAEYDAEIKILKDPTGKLYTEGKISEFLKVQQDKFEKLSKILQKRPESGGVLPINMINRLENSTEIKFIGMVSEKRLTNAKNYLIQFEDPTGDCVALVQQKKTDVYKLIDYLLPDHVVIVDGFLSVNEKTNSRIILVNDIIFPDSPNTHTVQTPEEDIAMCLISDTHFGSIEWLEKIWYRFVDYLNCRVGNHRQRTQAGKIKYLCIAGDIVDGIGVYPNQEKHLRIKDIYQQYEACASYLTDLPDYIEIIIIPGDHDAVRKAVPAPSLPKDFAEPLYNQGYTMLGNPSMVSLHGIKTQLFHGTSLIDLNMAIPGMSNEDPFGTMKEFIRARDLVPTYGKKTEFAPVEENWFVLDELPDVLHTGHLHKNGYGKYHGILLVNSGCFQDQTEFMDSLGIIPDYGKPTVVNMKGNLTPKVIDLVGDM